MPRIVPLLSRLVAVAAFTTLAAPVLAAQGVAPASSGDSASVAAVVHRFDDALARGDSGAAIALLAPDLVVLEAGGREDLADYRAHHLREDIAFAGGVRKVPGPLVVTVVGDAAWAVSTSTSEGTYEGRAINSTGAELMVLSRGADGAWRIRAIHWSSRSRRAAK